MLATNKYKVLIIAPSWVGDLVMSQTLFKLLKIQHGENLELDVFANSWTIDILSRMPEVNNIIQNPFEHKKLSLSSRIRIGYNLRKHKYDQVFVLPNSLKSAIVPFFAKIKRRTGFIGEFRYILLNDAYKLNKEALPRMVDRFCALANNGEKPYKVYYPHLEFDLQNRYELIEKFKININKKLVAFCPAAEYGKAKRWLPEYFAQLADMLGEDECSILILGSKKDFDLGNDIVCKTNKKESITNLCGKTSLADTIDIVTLCSNVVTNDSGLMHVACAVNTNVIAIYGSSSPNFTPPLSDKAQIVKIDLNCSPCFQRTCKYDHYNCLRFITPDVIYHRIKNDISKLAI
ncbi:MAG: lipopolysaccharide heptosyltransferase II [Neisseriaceae bacterium]